MVQLTHLLRDWGTRLKATFPKKFQSNTKNLRKILFLQLSGTQCYRFALLPFMWSKQTWQLLLRWLWGERKGERDFHPLSMSACEYDVYVWLTELKSCACALGAKKVEKVISQHFFLTSRGGSAYCSLTKTHQLGCSQT